MFANDNSGFTHFDDDIALVRYKMFRWECYRSRRRDDRFGIYTALKDGATKTYDLNLDDCSISSYDGEIYNLGSLCVWRWQTILVAKDEINGKTVTVPLNTIAQSIMDKYSKTPDERLLPFILAQDYNDAIKLIFHRAKINRQVVILDPQTRTEKRVPIASIAASHLARRTFAGLLYKQVRDPNLVGSLTGHVEGSRAFARYRNIDEDMKKDLVKLLE